MAKMNADELVLNLMQKVKERKEEIKSLSKPNWLTTCTFSYNPEELSNRINIQTVTSQSKIVEIYSFFIAKERDWEQANKELGLSLPPVYMAYPISSWKSDLKTRSSQINITEKKKELEILEKRLDGLITVEQRRELELVEIQAQLGQ